MPLSSRNVRLFVSSPFSDMKAERNALQAHVFPKLQSHCQTRGWSFQAIDLRWGVSTEAALDQSAMRICLAEIARCQAVTPRPNFLVLLGDRYGWRPLPDALPASELDALLPLLPPERQGRLLWRDEQPDDAKGWYRRDNNALVPLPNDSPPVPDAERDVFCMLRPRTGRFESDDIWTKEVEQPLGAALRLAARTLWPDPGDPRRIKFEASATEQEIVAGALEVPDAREHVRAFFRRIVRPDGTELRRAEGDLTTYRDFVDLRDDGARDTGATSHLERLEERLRSHIGDERPAYMVRAEDHGVATLHLPAFIDDVLRSLTELVDAQIATHADQSPVDEEPLRHWAHARVKAGNFMGREADLEAIGRYLRGEGPAAPLLVTGVSGLGKSALLARAALDLENKGPSQVVARFVGATPGSGEVRTLLEGLCRELGTLYGADNSNLAVDANRLAVELRERLKRATAEKPLVVFIDALDQLHVDAGNVLTWLPRELGPHVRIVASVTPGELTDVLARGLLQARRHEVQPLDEASGRRLLARLLDGAHRRLTSAQTERVMAGFRAGGLPLYLRLAFETARKWASFEDKPELGDDVRAVLDGMFRGLVTRSRHDEVLMNRAMGFLACSRQGLAERELLSLLAQDEDYWPRLTASAHHELPKAEDGQPVRQVPVVIWSRLYHELEPYLSWRNAHGVSVMTFFHESSFEPVLHRLFLAEPETAERRHAAMAKYFVDAARGRDPDEPWLSGDVRGHAESVFHLVKAHDVHGSSEMLTDIAFVAGKLRHGQVFELLDDYRLGIEALPEARQELEEEHQSQSRLARWTEEITEYARQWDHRRRNKVDLWSGPEAPKLPEAPRSARIWTDEELDAGYPEKRNQPRLEKLRQFEGFILRELHPLKVFGRRAGFVIQHALATISQGPARYAAQMASAHMAVPMLLRRWPRGFVGKQESARLTTIEAEDEFTSIALTPDGKWAVTGSRDKTVRVWNIENCQCVRTLEGHIASVSSVAISADGRHGISGSSDGTLRVWDLESGQCFHTLTCQGSVKVVAMTPDGQRAILSNSNATVEVWDIEAGLRIHSLEGHKPKTGTWCVPAYRVNGVAITPDGRRAVSGGWDQTLHVWDIETGQCMLVLEGHCDEVWSTAISIAGNRAVSGGLDPGLRVWDLDSGQCLRTLSGHADAVTPHRKFNRGLRAIALTPDGRWAISGSQGHTNSIRIWDVEGGRCLRTLAGHTFDVAGVAVTADCRRVVSVSRDKTLRIWNVADGNSRRALEAHDKWIRIVVLTHDSRLAVTGSWDNDLRVWDLKSGLCLHTLKGHDSHVDSIAVTTDGQRAVSASSDCTLRVWSLESGQCLNVLKGHTGGVSAVLLTPDDQRIVSCSSDHNLRTWDLESGKCLQTLTGHRQIVNSIATTSDGRWVVSCSWDWSLRVWDLENGRCPKVLQGHGYSVDDVILTPDGCCVLSRSQDTTIRLWAIRDGQCLQVFGDSKDFIDSFAVTPDGRQVVWGGHDLTIRVSDLRSGRCVRRLEGHTGWVQNLRVTHDGRRVVSVSDDHTLRVWDIESGLCLAVYVGASALYALALGEGDNLITAGAQSGDLLLLETAGIPTAASIVTATCSGRARCPNCGASIQLEDSIVSAIWHICANLNQEQSPCFDLPDDAFCDARLLSTCPQCDGTLKLNPFFSDSEWTPVDTENDRIDLVVHPPDRTALFSSTDSSPSPAPSSDGSMHSGKIMRVGRNDSCPCGSGKRFKECHGKLT